MKNVKLSLRDNAYAQGIGYCEFDLFRGRTTQQPEAQMAEIHIEKKQTSVWMWLIPLLILAAIVLLWWNGRDADVVGMQGVADSPAAASADNTAGSGAVGDFTRFVATSEAGMDESRMHAFAIGGLRRLATALESLNPGTEAASALTEMRQQTDSLEQSPTESMRHSDMVRAAFVAGANAFSRLSGVMDGEVSKLRTAAENVTAGTPLLEQQNSIEAYFRAASSALEPMSRN